MGGFLLLVLWLGCVAAAVTVAWYAKPILAGGLTFSSPEPVPMPGRHYGRRLRRWWRNVDLGGGMTKPKLEPAVTARQALCFSALPIIDVKAARLAGLHLQAHPAMATAELSPAEWDQAVLERAVVYGRKLGWRHSSTTLVVPLVATRASLGSANAIGGRLLRRYAGDSVMTVPPLLLLVSEPAELEQQRLLDLARQLGIGLALRTDELPGILPSLGIERLFVPTGVIMASLQHARALQEGGCRIVATDVADLPTLERLAKAGISLASGPAFGKPHLLEQAQPIETPSQS